MFVDEECEDQSINQSIRDRDGGEGGRVMEMKVDRRWKGGSEES